MPESTTAVRGEGHDDGAPTDGHGLMEFEASDVPEPPAKKTVRAWAVQKGLSVPPNHKKRTGDYYTHSPNELEGAIQFEVSSKRWPARDEELVTEEEFDVAVKRHRDIRIG